MLWLPVDGADRLAGLRDREVLAGHKVNHPRRHRMQPCHLRTRPCQKAPRKGIDLANRVLPESRQAGPNLDVCRDALHSRTTFNDNRTALPDVPSGRTEAGVDHPYGAQLKIGHTVRYFSNDETCKR